MTFLTEAAKELTPVELVDGLYFKREDKFAPLGYGGINGSKLRQLVWMLSSLRGYNTILSASHILSPQISMGAVVSRMMGMTFVQLLGRSEESAHSFAHNENVRIAERIGTTFYTQKGGYNGQLQAGLKKLNEKFTYSWPIPYAISPPPGTEKEFHAVGRPQVTNLPRVKRLIIPHGSTNSAATVLYGLKSYGINYDEIHLVGISPPTSHKHLWQRMKKLGYTERDFPEVQFHDIFSMFSWAKYDGWVADSWGDIQFHPTYEGKIMRWLKNYRSDLLEDACFWIVGSEPHWEPMAEKLAHLEEEPRWLQM